MSRDRDRDIYTGRNATPFKTGKRRCGRCGFICDTKRDIRASYGSKMGQGVAYVEGINDFTITGGCPMCGIYTYDKGAAK